MMINKIFNRWKRFMLFLKMALFADGKKKAEYLKKIRYFGEQGENVYWQPSKLPPEPELIKLGDNVVIASEVLFITHEVIHYMAKHLETGNYQLNLGAIEVGNNIFIGSRTLILPNVKIASNIIIGAGSIVSQDLRESGVYVGSPAKKIGEFDDFIKKRRVENLDKRNKEKRYKQVWEEFYSTRLL